MEIVDVPEWKCLNCGKQLTPPDEISSEAGDGSLCLCEECREKAVK